MWTDPVESVTRSSGGRGREKPIDRLRRTARSSNANICLESQCANWEQHGFIIGDEFETIHDGRRDIDRARSKKRCGEKRRQNRCAIIIGVSACRSK